MVLRLTTAWYTGNTDKIMLQDLTKSGSKPHSMVVLSNNSIRYIASFLEKQNSNCLGLRIKNISCLDKTLSCSSHFYRIGNIMVGERRWMIESQSSHLGPWWTLFMLTSSRHLIKTKDKRQLLVLHGLRSSPNSKHYFNIYGHGQLIPAK